MITLSQSDNVLIAKANNLLNSSRPNNERKLNQV